VKNLVSQNLFFQNGSACTATPRMLAGCSDLLPPAERCDYGNMGIPKVGGLYNTLNPAVP
jgi:hypothetical protein